MDVLNFRLTEVSLELLGNNFYDIFGQKCDTLGSLYRRKSGQTTNAFAAKSDLVAALKVEDIFNGNDELPEETHGGSLRNVNCKVEANSETSSDESDERDEPEYSENRAHNRSTELKITKILNDVEEGKRRIAMITILEYRFIRLTVIFFIVLLEYTRLLMHSESTKMKYFITNKHRMETDYEDEYEICNRFHTKENAELMFQSDAFIKLIKYIKSDTRNAFKMGEIAATILKVKDLLSDDIPSKNQ